MSLLDRFRSWLGLEVRRFDGSIQADTENAAEYIKQRTVMHVETMHRDVEAFFDDMIAEQQRQRHEDKPLTFGPARAGRTCCPCKAGAGSSGTGHTFRGRGN